MKPKVSVIVPVYNREKLIVRCLDSIVNQTVKPDEVIVVDNGSTDNTLAEINKWNKINSGHNIPIKILQEPKKGACSARQKGFLSSTGDFIIFFDSDDAMHKDLVENFHQVLRNNPGMDIVCWKCRIIQLDNSIRIPPLVWKNPMEGHLIHALIRPQGTAIKRNFIIDTGGWFKSLNVWNDYELGLRILLLNPKIKGINKILADIYSQEESITGTDFSSREGEWEKTLMEMESEALNSTHHQKKRIKRILDYRRAILAAHYFREGNKAGANRLMKLALSQNTFAFSMSLQFSYLYTRLGLRGAWRIVKYFI